MSPREARGLVGRSAATVSIRDQILLAALECFLEKGYQGTSVRDIANRTELSVPGLYHHFESKMAMLEELMNETMDDLLSDVREGFELARPDPVNRFEAVVESHVRFHCERREESFLGNSAKPRLSVGAGVNWNSPFGPLRIDLAYALLRDKGDDTKIVTFNVGTQF